MSPCPASSARPRRTAPRSRPDGRRSPTGTPASGSGQPSSPPGAADGDAPGYVRVWRDVREPPLVSIVVPTIGSRRVVDGEERLLVAHMLRSLVERTTYERWELVLVTSEGTPPEGVTTCEEILGDLLTLAPVAGAFNFSRSVNTGAAAARGELLLLLNDDVDYCLKAGRRPAHRVYALRATAPLRVLLAHGADRERGAGGAGLVAATHDGRSVHQRPRPGLSRAARSYGARRTPRVSVPSPSQSPTSTSSPARP